MTVVPNRPLCAVAIPLLLPMSMVCAGAPEPRADGLFDDWAGLAPVATDPIGDASNISDITTVYAQNRGTVLYLRFDTNVALNVQSGPSDDQVPRVLIGLPDGGSLTLDLRDRRSYLDGNQSSTVSWEALSLRSAPTFAAEEFEIRVDLGSVGVDEGDTVSIDFFGSDSLAAPAAVTLDAPAPPIIVRDAGRESGTDFRVASLNTLSTGLLDGTRGPALRRLIDAVDADIYALQEEYQSSASTLGDILEDVDPFGDGATWNVHKNNDNVIASRSPLTPMPAGNSKYAAAVVELPTGPIAVLSIHPKCCGHIGSSEDAQRIGETQDMIDTLNDLRAGDLGPALLPFADVPVLVIGDWNLVGSRTPLTMFESEPALMLGDWLLPNLVGEDVVTWIGSSTGAGSFAPGRLDLAAHSLELSRRNGYVLDTRELDGPSLAALGLQAADSDASDHLMLVTDFGAAGCPGDTNGDGIVDLDDLNNILAAWNTTVGVGDPLDVAGNDGIVDLEDLNAVLAAWGAHC